MATEETRPAYDDLAAMIREIAESDPEYDTGEGYSICRHCDGEMVQRGEGKAARFVVEHDEDCRWQRARALAARLPPG